MAISLYQNLIHTLCYSRIGSFQRLTTYNTTEQGFDASPEYSHMNILTNEPHSAKLHETGLELIKIFHFRQTLPVLLILTSEEEERVIINGQVLHIYDSISLYILASRND